MISPRHAVTQCDQLCNEHIVLWDEVGMGWDTKLCSLQDAPWQRLGNRRPFIVFFSFLRVTVPVLLDPSLCVRVRGHMTMCSLSPHHNQASLVDNLISRKKCVVWRWAHLVRSRRLVCSGYRLAFPPLLRIVHPFLSSYFTSSSLQSVHQSYFLIFNNSTI